MRKMSWRQERNRMTGMRMRRNYWMRVRNRSYLRMGMKMGCLRKQKVRNRSYWRIVELRGMSWNRRRGRKQELLVVELQVPGR